MPDDLYGGGRTSKLQLALLTLKVGEGLRLEPGELRSPKALYAIISRIKKKYGFRYKYARNIGDNGWLFQRVK